VRVGARPESRKKILLIKARPSPRRSRCTIHRALRRWPWHVACYVVPSTTWPTFVRPDPSPMCDLVLSDVMQASGQRRSAASSRLAIFYLMVVKSTTLPW